MNIAQALQQASILGHSPSPEFDVQLLLADVLEKPRSYLFTWPQRRLLPEQQLRFEQMLARRVTGEPIAYILGYQDFWTLRLEVSSDTLIPRPDTELLVETALALNDNSSVRVADLGTGTGAVALALASERSAWQIVASDVVASAAALAERNRRSLGLENVEIRCGSWFEPLQGVFDLILSNPPYIELNDRHLECGDVRFEPATALVSGESGLDDITLIIDRSRQYLANQGWLLLEHGYDQGDAVQALMAQFGFAQIETLKDLADNDRVTMGCLGLEGV